MRAPKRPSPSPLSHPSVAVASAAHLVRRHRLGRLAVVLAIALVVVSSLRRADAHRAEAVAQWDATTPVWMTTNSIAAGDLVDPEIVVMRTVPAALVPSDATAEDPTGTRVRIDLAAGEIIVDSRLADADSPIGARTPDGWRTLSIRGVDDVFALGDHVDLHHAIDGHLLSPRALVVATHDGGLGVAVPPGDVGAVVRAIGQAGVVPALVG